MKKELNPTVAVILVVVVVLVIGGLFYMKTQSPGGKQPSAAEEANNPRIGGKVVPMGPVGGGNASKGSAE